MKTDTAEYRVEAINEKSEQSEKKVKGFKD